MQAGRGSYNGLLAYLGILSAVFSVKNKRNVGVSFWEEKKAAKYIGISFIHTLGIEGGLLWKKINYSFFIGEVKKPLQETPPLRV